MLAAMSGLVVQADEVKKANKKKATTEGKIEFRSHVPEAAATKAELRESIPLAEWKWLEHDGMKIAVGVYVLPSFGESYIDVYGYVYNRHFKEWRQFCIAKTRNAGHVEVLLDPKQGFVKVIGAANNRLKGKTVVMWNIAALSDGRAYVK
ncbi:MAG: hypothetical protein IID44_23670 [Planctomycetes bacterium]|nr:hypothetical protein [Planctomycetota bacterium]